MFPINRRLLVIGLMVLLLGVVGLTFYVLGQRRQQQSAPQPAAEIRPTALSARLPDQPAPIQNAVSEAVLPPTTTIALPVAVVGALSETQAAVPAAESASLTSINPLFQPSLFQSEGQPGYLIYPEEIATRSGGALWRGSWNPPNQNAPLPLIAITDTTGWVEADCGMTTAAGVQFLGDQNDGWARIILDQQYVWTGNTWGGDMAFDKYVEFPNLPLANHTLRLEATGEPGTPGGAAQVTIAGFGCGPLFVHSNRVYLPLVVLL